jgi:exopolyphosphatase/guanosine-5'-triphosphate,3'-diphosphate pyrophosphatase
MRLSEPNRYRTKQLAAILRVADALDRTHRQQVGRVRAVQKNKRVKLELDCGGDCLLERWALDQKKGLFIEVFGRDLALTNVS